jgi:hypothetical protein
MATVKTIRHVITTDRAGVLPLGINPPHAEHCPSWDSNTCREMFWQAVHGSATGSKYNTYRNYQSPGEKTL